MIRKQSVRFAIMVLVLTGTAIFLRAHGIQEVIPHTVPLESFPSTLGSWQGFDRTIDAETLQILGPGSFLSRDYVENAQTPPIDLFVAYFPSQREGDTIHSPKNCLPGSGWEFSRSSVLRLRVHGHEPMTVGRYVIAKGDRRDLVIYWYEAHGRAVASEYAAKFYLVADSIRLNRTDGALVRIITPIAPNESEDNAEKRLISFTENVASQLGPYIPR